MNSAFSDIELLVLEKQNVSCEDVDALLYEIAEDELAPTLKEKVFAHIDHCPECQENIDSYRWVSEVAKSLRKPEPVSDQMSSDVRRRLREGLNKKLGLSLSISE